MKEVFKNILDVATIISLIALHVCVFIYLFGGERLIEKAMRIINILIKVLAVLMVLKLVLLLVYA